MSFFNRFACHATCVMQGRSTSKKSTTTRANRRNVVSGRCGEEYLRLQQKSPQMLRASRGDASIMMPHQLVRVRFDNVQRQHMPVESQHLHLRPRQEQSATPRAHNYNAAIVAAYEYLLLAVGLEYGRRIDSCRAQHSVSAVFQL